MSERGGACVNMAESKAGTCPFTVVEAYTKDEANELSLSKGEVVYMNHMYDDGWSKVCNQAGAEGYVPTDYLEEVRNEVVVESFVVKDSQPGHDNTLNHPNTAHQRAHAVPIQPDLVVREVDSVAS